MRESLALAAIFLALAVHTEPGMAAEDLMAGEGSLGLAGQVRVIDGDTIAIDGVRVRLVGIDTPEIGEPGAAYAQGRLFITISLGGPLKCDLFGGDRYGRLLAACRDRFEQDLGKHQVVGGAARAYGDYGDLYEPFEVEARATGRGLWSCKISAPPGWVRPDCDTP